MSDEVARFITGTWVTWGIFIVLFPIALVSLRWLPVANRVNHYTQVPAGISVPVKNF